MLTSLQNPQVKELVRLRDSRRHRHERGLFVAEGHKLASEAAASGVELLQLFVTRHALDRYPREIAGLSTAAGEVVEISDQVAEKIAWSENPQGVFALCRLRDSSFSLDKIRKDGHYLLANSLQDPGNLGTIIRSCEAFGADGLILSGDCPDLWSPKVLRGAMGGAFRLPVYLTGDMGATVEELRREGIPVYAAALTDTARPVGELSLREGCGVLIGNEGSGLPAELIRRCDEAVIIPIASATESLNAAIAASVFLWEMRRQQDSL